MELPDEDTLRFIVTSYARVREGFADLLPGAVLLQPTAEHFPDEVEASPEGVRRVLDRVRSYSPLSADLPLELGFVEDEGASKGGGCGTGACGTGAKAGGDAARGGVVETADGYGVLVHVADASDPTLLVASLCRGVGAVVLAEGEVDVSPKVAGPLSEIACVAMGMGVLLASAACLYKKGCGGMRMHQGTFLGVEELSTLLALYTRVHGVKPSLARAHLETTQREAFDEALRWVDSNDALVEALRDAPHTLSDGVFAIEPTKGLLGRWFKRKAPPVATTPAATPRRKRSPEEERRLAEARALVDEALGE